jgi:Holliday junction resolvase RusA-like endonuclease
MDIHIGIRPLTINKAWVGRRFKSSEYKQYESDVSKLLPRSKNMIKGEVEIRYLFYIKNYAITDVDNMIKPIQDLLVKKGYIEDDRKIVVLLAQKFKSELEKMIITIKPI